MGGWMGRGGDRRGTYHFWMCGCVSEERRDGEERRMGCAGVWVCCVGWWGRAFRMSS